MGFLDSIRREAAEYAKQAARQWLDNQSIESDSHDASSGKQKNTVERTPRRSGTETPDLAIVAVADWVDAGRPRQKPIDWPQVEWIGAFPEHEEMLASMDNPLSRADVRETARSQPDDETGAVAAFVATMAWGYGRTGYGRSRTRKVLDSNSDAPQKLARAREVAANGGLRAAFDAYTYLAGQGRLEHLGPAFGTKFIHFHNSEGLILDKLTAEWYERACGIDLKPTHWNPDRYREYLAFMGGWAESVGVQPEELEEIAFGQVSRERGNQWA